MSNKVLLGVWPGPAGLLARDHGPRGWSRSVPFSSGDRYSRSFDRAALAAAPGGRAVFVSVGSSGGRQLIVRAFVREPSTTSREGSQ